MKQVALTNGGYALVDDEDAETAAKCARKLHHTEMPND